MTWIRRASKFGNRRTTLAGISFDSRREARRWTELQWMAKAGEIRELRRQVSFELAPATYIEGQKRKKPALRYVADFVYEDCATGAVIVEDTKSEATAKTKDFRMKKHLMKTVHGIDVKVTT